MGRQNFLDVEPYEAFSKLLILARDYEPSDERAMLGSFVDDCNERICELDFEEQQEKALDEE